MSLIVLLAQSAKYSIISIACTLLFQHATGQTDSSISATTFYVKRYSNTENNGSNKRIINPNFYFHNLDGGHPINLGQDTVKIDLQKPVFLLQASDLQTPFLIYPGESIQVEYDSLGKVGMYIRGDTQRTNELLFLKRLVEQTDNLSYAFKAMPFRKKVNSLNDISMYESAIGKRENERKEFLKNYVVHHSVSEQFFRIISNAIVYTASYDSLALYLVNETFLKEKGLFQGKIKKITSHAPTNPFSALLYSTRLLDLLISAYTKEKVNNLSSFHQQLDAIVENFSGPTKEYLLYKTYFDALGNYVEVPKATLQNFIGTAQNKEYAIMLNHLKQLKSGVKSLEDDAVFGTDNIQHKFSDIIAASKGNVVLIDFWASWCAPCRQEMVDSKKLQKLYEGKPVKFLFFSVDTDKEKWLKAHKEEKLNSNSYLILKIDNFKLAQTGNTVSVPKYVLIDKFGKVLLYDAPRPSDTKLKDIIDKNL